MSKEEEKQSVLREKEERRCVICLGGFDESLGGEPVRIGCVCRGTGGWHHKPCFLQRLKHAKDKGFACTCGVRFYREKGRTDPSKKRRSAWIKTAKRLWEKARLCFDLVAFFSIQMWFRTLGTTVVAILCCLPNKSVARFPLSAITTADRFVVPISTNAFTVLLVAIFCSMQWYTICFVLGLNEDNEDWYLRAQAFRRSRLWSAVWNLHVANLFCAAVTASTVELFMYAAYYLSFLSVCLVVNFAGATVCRAVDAIFSFSDPPSTPRKPSETDRRVRKLRDGTVSIFNGPESVRVVLR